MEILNLLGKKKKEILLLKLKLSARSEFPDVSREGCRAWYIINSKIILCCSSEEVQFVNQLQYVHDGFVKKNIFLFSEKCLSKPQ